MTLMDLLDDVAAVLVLFMDPPSLIALARCVRNTLPPIAAAAQRHVVLRLPPDAARAAGPHRLISSASEDDCVQLWSTQFAVADTVHAAALLPICQHVRGLEISSNEYTAWPEQPFQWDTVATFTSLVRLVIDHLWDRPLDLAMVSPSCPCLHTLVIKRARNLLNRIDNLPHLVVLHLEDTNIASFSIAVGFARLTSLTLLTTPYNHAWLRDAACLFEIAPLTHLTVRGDWKECPIAAVASHAETLQTYAELDNAYTWCEIGRNRHPTWSMLRHLRVLRTGRFGVVDTSPLATLVALEHLQLAQSVRATHCRPLRQLTNLRELQIANGWPCDLVGYLPRLETLVWEDRHWCDNLQRTTLRRRAPSDKKPWTASSRLRRLVLRGSVSIDPNCPDVRAMLAPVETVEVHERFRVDEVLQVIAELRHLKRLLFQRLLLPLVVSASHRPYSFACAEVLEELYYDPAYCDTCGKSPMAPFPLWFHDRLPRLRVLASPFDESLAELTTLCPSLTHLHLPFSTACAFPDASRQSLRQLCVVSLAVAYDCTWLRREMGPGRALPSLQRILHPTTDCLSSSVCHRRRLAVGRDGSGYQIV